MGSRARARGMSFESIGYRRLGKRGMAKLGGLTITGKVFVQIGDGELVEVGEVEIPVEVSAGPRPPVTRSQLDIQKG
ncbi:hypothetical protein PBI_DAOB_1 [Arthrobacter phage Daob]|uniref:Uncharacterized protein n=2 Tax=Coralvirus coral TaxID=2734227 RepID=A0A3G2KFB7_9CAUD|nr:hypothetical protein PBI_DAOB_1 [Arthrobacter phage Daob]